MAGTEMLPAAVVAGTSNNGASYTNGIASDSSSLPVSSERQAAAAADKKLPSENTEAAAKASLEEVSKAIQSISDRVEHMARKLEFSVSDPSGKVIVTVFDKTSEEVIRQIPGEQAIAIAEHIASLAKDVPVLGLLLDSQA